MATTIMLYHYLWWATNKLDSSTVLGKLGIYGVCIFYILSGVTLYFIYHNSIHHKNGIKSFAIKRIFRIFPLLWFVYITSLILQKYNPGFYLLFINFTGLFGFIDPSAYLSTGAWSIGNELFFYACFPLLMYIINKKDKQWYLITFLVTLITGMLIAFYISSCPAETKIWWPYYVNPFNQLFYFAGGIGIGYLYSVLTIPRRFFVATLITSASIFIFYPVGESAFELCGGWNRFLFINLSFLLTASFIFLNPSFPPVISRLFTFLGETSYSIYLIHGLIYNIVKLVASRFFHCTNGFMVFITALPVTFIASYFLYHYLETPAIRLGAKIASRFSSKEMNKTNKHVQP